MRLYYTIRMAAAITRSRHEILKNLHQPGFLIGPLPNVFWTEALLADGFCKFLCVKNLRLTKRAPCLFCKNVKHQSIWTSCFGIQNICNRCAHMWSFGRKNKHYLPKCAIQPCAKFFGNTFAMVNCGNGHWRHRYLGVQQYLLQPQKRCPISYPSRGQGVPSSQ